MAAVAPQPPPADGQRVVLFVAPGSPAAHFAGKVVVALDAYNIKHYCNFVDLLPAKRTLPSGGTVVPEMVIGDTIVSDSEAILHSLETTFGLALFPNERAGELSQRASDGILLACALFYNLVHEQTYRKSVSAQFEAEMPAYFCCFKRTIVDRMAASFRDKNRLKAFAQLGEWPPEAEVRAKLIAELQFFQSLLQAPGQRYLLPDSTRGPSAADISLYVVIERIVGSHGDVPLRSPLPELVSEEATRLARLWEWHRMMKAAHPIVFKGKRLPAAK